MLNSARHGGPLVGYYMYDTSDVLTFSVLFSFNHFEVFSVFFICKQTVNNYCV